MKKILDAIDQFIWEKGGILYKLWFKWTPNVPEEKDHDTGAIMGTVNRRFFNN